MKKAYKISSIILVICVILYFLASWLSPGNYVNAEKYVINAKDSTVIGAIKQFKASNPKYELPSSMVLKEGYRDKNDHWYHIWFYYPEENKIIKTWIRPMGKEETTFAFVGINEGLNLGNWKGINKDFSYSENRKEKKKFEEKILNKIKEYLVDEDK